MMGRLGGDLIGFYGGLWLGFVEREKGRKEGRKGGRKGEVR